MPRHSSESERSRIRALPWLLLLRVGVVVGQRVGELSEKDRTTLVRLLRESRGWPWSLAARERKELGRLVGKLDLQGMGRELVPILQGRRRGGKRHR